MFKKLREKISEEVQQTSLRLPASVQQITQQVTGVCTLKFQHRKQVSLREVFILESKCFLGKFLLFNIENSCIRREYL